MEELREAEAEFDRLQVHLEVILHPNALSEDFHSVGNWSQAKGNAAMGVPLPFLEARYFRFFTSSACVLKHTHTGNLSLY